MTAGKKTVPVCPPPLAYAFRGGIIESVHRGHIAVSTPDGELVRSFGDPDFPTYLRSAAKPFQAIRVVEDGAADRYGLTDPELALMCGSVNGQDYHVEAVRSVLSKIGMDESVLQCGVQAPSHKPTRKAMELRGEKPLPVHNNCAGKHAAMLVLCAHHGFPVEDYHKPGHPVQELIMETVADMIAVEPSSMGVGIDGCGVPVFCAPLRNIALGYARFACPEESGLNRARASAAKKLLDCALAYPEMIAGDGRVCTETMRQAPGRLFAKAGAEASYGLSLLREKLGIAFKVEDGSMRAINPVVIEILKAYSLAGEAGLGALSEFHNAPIVNYRRETVGQVAPAPIWSENP